MKLGRKIFNSKIFRFVWVFFILLILLATFSTAFFLTGLIYKFIHLKPIPLFEQFINALLGLVFIGLLLNFFTSTFHTQRSNAFTPIFKALDRIARGDFRFRINDEYEQDGILGELATSVNKVALELDQMETMRQEFISNVSHEIQSPLTSIRGFAQVLQDEKLSPTERLHYLGIIETESARLSRLADDLLKLASLESEQVSFEPRRYRLDSQIRSLILTCEPQWAAKSIEMDISLENQWIVADENLLSQVWLNLLHNAIKFSPEHGLVKISLEEQNNQAIFTIRDSGIGISPAEQAHIFERFYKADKSRNRTVEGSGLGLSIAKKIIDLHQGSISVESQLGQGATFTVRLPTEA